jgi:hypothetical protein
VPLICTSLQVKYLGRLPIKASRDSPPDGQTCAITVSHLSRLRSRDKHRYGAAKQQTMCVSCSRGSIVFTAHDDSTGQSMRIPLLEVTCVADHDSYVCFVAGKLRPDGVLACWSHAFECESDWASRYLREEIIGACQVAFGKSCCSLPLPPPLRCQHVVCAHAQGHAGGGRRLLPEHACTTINPRR